jgi:hypothetical protein
MILFIRNHKNLVHDIQSHLFKFHFNIIFQSMPSYSKWCLSYSFPHQNSVRISLVLIMLKIFGEENENHKEYK